MSDRPYWCEICARKKECYGITLKPKCFVPMADHKTEPTRSKMEQVDKDINVRSKDEPQTIRCPKCGRTDYIRDMEKDMGIKGSHYKYKCINCNTYIKDEPTRSKMEQVDKDINVRSKEPQIEYCPRCGMRILVDKPKDEPQTERESE